MRTLWAVGAVFFVAIVTAATWVVTGILLDIADVEEKKGGERRE